MAITFRANKGQALTYGEMDTNLGSYFYSSSIESHGTELVLHYTGSLNVPVNKASHRVPLIAGIGSLGNDRRLAFFSGSAALNSDDKLFVDLSGSLGIGISNYVDVLTHKLTVSGSIGINGTVEQISDQRFKSNVQEIDSPLTRILSSRGVTFDMGGRKQVGVIAQEIQKTIPEVVSEDNQGYLSVSYSNVVGVLIEAIKEQDKKIASLEAKLDNLLDK